MFLQKAIFRNIAPFGDLDLDFTDKGVTVLSGINGSGKTTILSYIADAFYEFAKCGNFHNDFENRRNKYYRITTPLGNLALRNPSIVYLRFRDGDKNIDYVQVINATEEYYDSNIKFEDKIHFAKNIPDAINNASKATSLSGRQNNGKNATQIFENNLLTNFPAYRLELPLYLNDIYKEKIHYTTEDKYAGYLPNQIDVVTDFKNILNWLLDITVDVSLYKEKENNIQIFKDAVSILTLIVEQKLGFPVRYGIGERNLGGRRIQVINKENEEIVYPTLYGMSSGEQSLLCLFSEVLRQADNISKNSADVTGIVLVDEIDKHLHIKLQREVLPRLFSIFPNVQFIVTSHSPFFAVGLEKQDTVPYEIIDMDCGGSKANCLDTDLYEDVYNSIISENENYRALAKELREKLKDIETPLIITEGKTDVMHIKAAEKALGIADFCVEYHEGDNPSGNRQLEAILKDLAIVDSKRLVIGIFDLDNDAIFKNERADANSPYIHLGANVYALWLPLPENCMHGDKISIEHYYSEEELKKTDSDGRRLFLGNEFYDTGNSKDAKYTTRISQIQNKVKINGIIDEKVYETKDPENKKDIARSKTDFATYVSTHPQEFDFSNFRQLFNTLKQIIKQSAINTEKTM